MSIKGMQWDRRKMQTGLASDEYKDNWDKIFNKNKEKKEDAVHQEGTEGQSDNPSDSGGA